MKHPFPSPSRPERDDYARSIGADLDTPRYVLGLGLVALAGVFALCVVGALARAVVLALRGGA